MHWLITCIVLQALIFYSTALEEDNDAITISDFSFNPYYDTISGLPRKISTISFEKCRIKNMGYKFFIKFPRTNKFVFDKCEILLDSQDYFYENDLYLNSVTFKECDIKAKNDQITTGIWMKKLNIQNLNVIK